jgi:hypothetical protein
MDTNIDVIGITYKIGNLEIAQNDFPYEMNWNKSNQSCLELGDGWRLPTKEELELIYENKTKISGLAKVPWYWGIAKIFGFAKIGHFADAWYWSSSLVDKENAWTQKLTAKGGQFVHDKLYDYNHVRAVRSL